MSSIKFPGWEFHRSELFLLCIQLFRNINVKDAQCLVEIVLAMVVRGGWQQEEEIQKAAVMSGMVVEINPRWWRRIMNRRVQ